MTITDIAKKSGYSVGTVSAVLNDRPNVKPSTREQVLTVIDELDYRPSTSARALRTPGRRPESGSRTVGLIVKEGDNPYFTELMLGVRDFLEECGYVLFTSTSEGSYETEGDLIDAFHDRHVDGLIIAPVLDGQVDFAHLFKLKRLNFPFVLVGDVRGLAAPSVDVENAVGSQRAVQHLFEYGHTRIVHFAGPKYSQHARDRIQGVERAFSQSSLVFTDDTIVEAGAHLQDGYECGMRLLKNASPESRPTGITCFNDQVAIGLIHAAAELRLRVPEDLSIVGFDDIQIAGYLSVPLTTVQTPHRKMGRKAAELLVRQVEGGAGESPEKIVLESGIVVRKSTCPVAKDVSSHTAA